MFTISARTSSAVRFICVNPLDGTAIVEFSNGNAYSYKNVSRRAILNLMLNKNMSLGFWVNENLLVARTSTLSLA